MRPVLNAALGVPSKAFLKVNGGNQLFQSLGPSNHLPAILAAGWHPYFIFADPWRYLFKNHVKHDLGPQLTIQDTPLHNKVPWYIPCGAGRPEIKFPVAVSHDQVPVFEQIKTPH